MQVFVLELGKLQIVCKTAINITDSKFIKTAFIRLKVLKIFDIGVNTKNDRLNAINEAQIGLICGLNHLV